MDTTVEVPVVEVKKWYLSRTVWFNVIGFFVTIATSLLAAPDVKQEWVPTLMLIQTLGNIVLRLDTKTAIG